VQGGEACHGLSPAQTTPAQGSLCSQRSPGELCGPSTEPRSLPCLVPASDMAAGTWKASASLHVFKTQQQHPQARGQPQIRSELLSRVMARIPFTGIGLWPMDAGLSVLQGPMETILGIHVPSPLRPPFPQSPLHRFLSKCLTPSLVPPSQGEDRLCLAMRKGRAYLFAGGSQGRPNFWDTEELLGAGGWRQGFLGLSKTSSLQQLLWPVTISCMHPYNPISH